MDDEDLFKLLTGQRAAPISVCPLDDTLRVHLNAATNLVQLERPYALKIYHEHNIALELFALVKFAIRYGIAATARDKGKVQFFYEDRELTGKPFQCVIVAPRPNALFVQTFHRTTPSEISRILKKFPVLREHY